MSLTPARILVIDDDRKLSRLLVSLLRSNGFEAGAAYDGAEGLAQATAQPWDLVLLDVMMPELHGFQVLSELRKVSQIPVLMLTARGGDNDRVAGLDGGADDYVPKTASSRELLARIRALLRRAAPLADPPATAPRELSCGALSVVPEARSATLGGQELALTAVEFDLLLALMQAGGRVLSRADLLEQVRDREQRLNDRSIDVHVVALRRKLGDDPRQPQYIRTVRSSGYRFIGFG